MLPMLCYVLLILLSLAAIALNIFSLPGNWVMMVLAVATACLNGWYGWQWAWLGLLVLVLVAGEVIELLGSLVGAKKFGASKSATWAAIAGAFLGAILGTPVPYIGNIVGAILGAFLAAWIVELIKRRPFKTATWAAVGAALGRTVGMVAKVSCGLLVWLILAWLAFPR